MPLSDASLARLRRSATWPEIAGGRYTILEEIGRGGMGTVYLASDNELGREVALKIPNGIDHAALEERLRGEARVLAQLEHPGIVPIHDVGRLTDGRSFYVMKRVRGRALLLEHVGEIPDLNERLRVFERICEPVAFAHAAGVIHRDLKPDNVMVGSFGEVLVMDWGIAKHVAESELQSGTTGAVVPPGTHAGTVLGTVGFMPPEQASGSVGVDRRADVYSLGVILFLLLTGRQPSADGDPATAIRSCDDVPRPLRAICAKAADPSPGNRYSDVDALAADVARYRAGNRVEAYEESFVERSVRLARRYRVAILLVLAYIVMRVAVAVLAGW